MGPVLLSSLQNIIPATLRQALESEAVMGRFHAVYDKLNQALDDVSYDELGISVEVKEQVELMCMQLKRAKRRTDTQDIELAMDLMVVFSKEDDRNADSILQWCEKNNVELPKKDSSVDSDGSSAELKDEISSLVQNLLSSHLHTRKEAVVKLPMLSKENPDNMKWDKQSSKKSQFPFAAHE